MNEVTEAAQELLDRLDMHLIGEHGDCALFPGDEDGNQAYAYSDIYGAAQQLREALKEASDASL